MTDATYYFIGGEVEAFVAGSDSGITWTTTAGRFDPKLARGAVRLPGIGNTKYIHTPLKTSQAECYNAFVHYLEGPTGGSINPTNTAWFTYHDSGLTARFRVMGVGGSLTQPVLQWQYWSGTAWVGVGTSFVVPTDIIHKWDMEFSSDASAGFARAYCDGRLLGELTGNTAAVFSNIAERRTMTCGSVVNNTQVAPNLSEDVIIDMPTLGHRLATLTLTGVGATNTWTTGAVTDVDEAGTYSDADIISSDTADQLYTGVTSDLSDVAQTYLIDDLIIAYRALRGGAGPQNLKGVVRMDGVDYLSPDVVDGPNGGLVTAMGYCWAVFPNNPDTGVRFTPDEINTAGFETGGKSLA